MPDKSDSAVKTAAALRKDRQAAALRANLRKRKDQARGKRDAAREEPEASRNAEDRDADGRVKD